MFTQPSTFLKVSPANKYIECLLIHFFHVHSQCKILRDASQEAGKGGCSTGSSPLLSPVLPLPSGLGPGCNQRDCSRSGGLTVLESPQCTSHTFPCLFISATFLGNEKLTHYYQRKLEILISIMQTSISKNQIQLAL